MKQRTLKEIEEFFDIKLSLPRYESNKHLHYIDEKGRYVLRIPKKLCSDWFVEGIIKDLNKKIDMKEIKKHLVENENLAKKDGI